jgi:hypothetical protein
VEEKVE